MTAVERELVAFLAAVPEEFPLALVGGVAVSIRTEPRFTRDLDFAVGVVDEAAAARLVFELRASGYAPEMVLQHRRQERLSTVRLRRRPRAPLIDLLFASSGIESEIVQEAEAMEVTPGLHAPVARTGHLLAMKVLAQDDARPQDSLDLQALAAVADDREWARALEAARLIVQRGHSREKDLTSALLELRSRPRR